MHAYVWKEDMQNPSSQQHCKEVALHTIVKFGFQPNPIEALGESHLVTSAGPQTPPPTSAWSIAHEPAPARTLQLASILSYKPESPGSADTCNWTATVPPH